MAPLVQAFSAGASAPRARRMSVVASAEPQSSRRELVLNSVSVTVLGALFNFGAAPRPSGLGIKYYGGGVKTLALCPPTPNCISTAEELNDHTHYVPTWNYMPQDGRGRKGKVPQTQAMEELVEVVESLKPDNFTPNIIKRTADFLYVEYESPTFGFIDDVEFWFPESKPGIVEYRSASRIGESDGEINRKRIKAIRKALEKKGWESSGF
eukprot:TRINITY_DN4405_c0_g1_i5.p1 TRINITY_DN4405_c0_g1~~TRINITY_DN4405_c0_g1_i5.p1  ORF type:complete len:210 (+),score=20.57 TRINITY_DN4405_c0_g1_i5:372-1001(+)